MGISTSLFSIVNADWFAPWTVRNVERIRVVSPEVPLNEWHYWSRHAQRFSGLAAHKDEAVIVGGRMVSCEFVSANYFKVLNVSMLVGQAFDEREDEVNGPANSAVISHHVWTSQFGADANIIGRVVTLEQTDPKQKALSVIVVGVAPVGFEGPDTRLRQLVWMPLSAIRQTRRTGASQNATPGVRVFGRLAPGVTVAQAHSELSYLHGQFRVDRTSPSTPIRLHTTDRYSRADLPPQARIMITALIAGVTFITLIACANASNLLLARGQERRGETAVRFALGATRARVLRQLLIESFLLCLIAGVVGVIISAWLPEALFDAVIRNTSAEVGEFLKTGFPLDRRVFMWAFAISTVACVAFGLGPALRCSQVDMGEVIKESHGASKRGLMPSILGYQTIVSVMALAIAGLMLRSVPVAEAVRIRQSVENVTVVRLVASRATDHGRRRELTAAIADRLASLSTAATVAGLTGQIQSGVKQTLHVTPNYFDLLRLPWIAGRTFANSDPEARVMVVNAAFAQHVWPDQMPLGQILSPGSAPLWDQDLLGRQVIGVVNDARLSTPTAYVAIDPKDVSLLLVRGDRSRVVGVLSPMQASLRGLLNLEVLSGSDWITTMVGPSILAGWLSVAFGALALALGTVGFFSLLDYAVKQRTREIGIRRALGAEPRHIIRSLIEPTARPLLRGVLIGTVGAVLVGVAMRQADLPSGVNPLDWPVYAAVAAVLLVAGFLASFAPARRAIRIEPSRALRVE